MNRVRRRPDVSRDVPTHSVTHDSDELRVEVEDAREFLRLARSGDELERRWRIISRQARRDGHEVPIDLGVFLDDRRRALGRQGPGTST